MHFDYLFLGGVILIVNGLGWTLDGLDGWTVKSTGEESSNGTQFDDLFFKVILILNGLGWNPMISLESHNQFEK